MISVIMGVHRVDDYLKKAIDSILNQENCEIEFIIIANGKEANIIENYILDNYKNESRLTILKTKISQLAHALNIGLNHAKYNYIARMDSDDISKPNRLSSQLDYLIKNNLDLVGCDLILIDNKESEIGQQIYPKGALIRKLIPYKNPFAHNTILAKTSTLINARGYNSGFNSEDYDLWIRLNKTNIKWENMNEKLVKYRIHSQATKGNILGYAESSALALREFILKKNIKNFSAVILQVMKAFINPKIK